METKVLASQCYWKLWQTGMDLYMRETLILKISEISIHSKISPYRNPDNRFKLKQDGIWSDLHLYKQRILEMVFPMLNISACDIDPDIADDITDGIEATIIQPNLQSTTKLLSLCVDHVDILLEDWYPTLGTRFMHTSEGNFLVNRIVPCLNCLQNIEDRTLVDEIKVDEDSSTSENSSEDASDPRTVESSTIRSGDVHRV